MLASITKCRLTSFVVLMVLLRFIVRYLVYIMAMWSDLLECFYVIVITWVICTS